MTQLQPSDFDSIVNCPLYWRWSKPTHEVIPRRVLSEVVPLKGAKAEEIFDLLEPFRSQSSLNRALFKKIIPFEGTNEIAVKRMLRSLDYSVDQIVLISWSPELCIRTLWHIFIEYWSDFCYPTSDDVSIIPLSGEWFLAYHHFEVFEFGIPAAP